MTRPWEETAFQFYVSHILSMPGPLKSFRTGIPESNILSILAIHEPHRAYTTCLCWYTCSKSGARNCIFHWKRLVFENWISFRMAKCAEKWKIECEKKRSDCKLNVIFYWTVKRKWEQKKTHIGMSDKDSIRCMITMSVGNRHRATTTTTSSNTELKHKVKKQPNK